MNIVDFQIENDMEHRSQTRPRDDRRRSTLGVPTSDEHHGCALLRINQTHNQKRTI